MVRTQTPDPPSTLNSLVPRDLEVICLKCLEKEPQRRYQSALALAEDLERWLDGRPILARPVGVAARIWLWCRRNRAIAAMAALVSLSLLGGIAGIAWKWREADHERKKTEAVNELLTRRLLSWASLELDPQSKNLTVRELIDRTAAQLGGWLQGQPDVEARIRETIGGVYLSLGRDDQAAPQVETAVRLDTELYGPRHRDTIRAINLLTLLLDRKGQGGPAEERARMNLETAEQSLGGDDPITLDSAERLGTILWHLGKTDLAEALLRKNVDDRRRMLEARASGHASLGLRPEPSSRGNASRLSMPNGLPMTMRTASSARSAPTIPTMSSRSPTRQTSTATRVIWFRPSGTTVRRLEKPHCDCGRARSTHTQPGSETRPRRSSAWPVTTNLMKSHQSSNDGDQLCVRIIRLVAALPLDVAAHARALALAGRLCRQDCIEGSPQVFAGDRHRVTRPAAVHLAAIDQFLGTVEDKKIRRAGGLICLGDRLSLVVEIRKRVADVGLFPGHHCRAIVGVCRRRRWS